MLVMIDTDCIGSCKSNYHTITITSNQNLVYIGHERLHLGNSMGTSAHSSNQNIVRIGDERQLLDNFTGMSIKLVLNKSERLGLHLYIFSNDNSGFNGENTTLLYNNNNCNISQHIEYFLY